MSNPSNPIRQAIATQVLEGACKGFLGGNVTIEDFRRQMMHILQLVPIAKPESTTDITLSHADLPGVITEALRESLVNDFHAQNMLHELDAVYTEYAIDLRQLAKAVSKALVLHARRNGG